MRTGAAALTAGLRRAAGLAALSWLLVGGCAPRSSQSATAVPAGGTPVGAGPPGAARPAAASGRTVTVAELEARRAAVQSCAVTITIDKDPPTTHLLKFQDGKLVRSVVELPGQTLTEGYVLVRADQHATYRVNPSDKTAVRIPEAAPPAGAGKAAPPASPTSPDLQNLAAETAWAEEPVDGAPCWKVETSREGGQWTIWVDEQYGLTRKMQSGETVIQEKYDKINAVPDSAFELPPGTIVTAGGSNPPSVPPAQSAPQTPSAPPAARAAHAPPGLERR